MILFQYGHNGKNYFVNTGKTLIFILQILYTGIQIMISPVNFGAHSRGLIPSFCRNYG